MNGTTSMDGKQVEQYLVLKTLKSGGMGAVYLAQDTMLDTPVALKFILSDFNEHPEMTKRFLEEAKTLAKLNLMNCPNIPILYRYFMWEGKAVMAMEYVSGESLSDMVHRRGPIPAAVSVPLIRQALHGLSFAHRLGVIHRDLKPANLMLNAEGTVKVIDFGIAKKLEVEAGLTRTNMTIGTPLYMAPEQVMGKPVTPRTDIYLMGLVLYELLAGQVPFNAASDFEISTMHVQRRPEPPTIYYPHIPKQVVDAVMKALEKEPSDRFASVEEFLTALPQLPDTMVQASGAGTAIFPTPSVSIVAPSQPIAPSVNAGYALDNQTTHTTSPASPSDSGVALPPRHEVSTHPVLPRTVLIGVAAGLLLTVAGGGTWLLLSGKGKGPDQQRSSIGANNPNLSEAPNAGGGGATQPPPVEPPPSKPPVHTTKPTQPLEPPERKTVPPIGPAPPVITGQELSGIWQGAYVNNGAPQDQTRVEVQMREANGKDIAGTLRFTTASNSSGACDLSASSFTNNKLQLLLHCSGSQVPAYLRTPTIFEVSSPSDRKLSGRVLYASNVSVHLERH